MLNHRQRFSTRGLALLAASSVAALSVTASPASAQPVSEYPAGTCFWGGAAYSPNATHREYHTEPGGSKQYVEYKCVNGQWEISGAGPAGKPASTKPKVPVAPKPPLTRH
jgi:hypothetical protein